MYVLLLCSGAGVVEVCPISCASDQDAIWEAFKRFEIISSLFWDSPNVDVWCGDRKVCNICEVL